MTNQQSLPLLLQINNLESLFVIRLKTELLKNKKNTLRRHLVQLMMFYLMIVPQRVLVLFHSMQMSYAALRTKVCLFILIFLII